MESDEELRRRKAITEFMPRWLKEKQAAFTPEEESEFATIMEKFIQDNPDLSMLQYFMWAKTLLKGWIRQ
ncbi:hypothetical protein GO755_18995 [Spirosoma sp. HMF4905]|uniref:Uncharacterized protein n=1 Tax=Spirosoma arboris TaxID=2682092 RepID=A0A7K1SEB2_9BACT|nr:hypothetical protein [Spirosoma arboris]MVM32145.1 hypothetical protein [Spirosoma arboris]